MHKPREVYRKVTLKIVTYTKGSLGKNLLYNKHGHLQIEAFSHSNHVGDKRDRKSSYGYCTYIGGNLVSWISKKRAFCLILALKLSIE